MGTNSTETRTLTDTEVLDAYPSVLIDRDNIEHYRGLLAQKLLINRCTACGYWIYPHRPLCPQCLSWDVVPTEVSGEGFVFTFTLIRQERDPKSMLQQPICVAAVELVERPGLRYLSQIVNCETDDIEPDMRVQLTWIERDGQLEPAFEPAPTDGGRD